MNEQKMKFVRQFRRLHSQASLELVLMHMESRLPATQMEAFLSAADHRRAELVTGRLFDKVPARTWMYVR